VAEAGAEAKTAAARQPVFRPLLPPKIRKTASKSPFSNFFQEKSQKTPEKFAQFKKSPYLCIAFEKNAYYKRLTP
jgi:hypothetical protein